MTKMIFVGLDQYDYHSILKVIEASGSLGLIKVFDAPNGYNIVFKDCIEEADRIFMQKLSALTNNIWMY